MGSSSVGHSFRDSFHSVATHQRRLVTFKSDSVSYRNGLVGSRVSLVNASVATPPRFLDSFRNGLAICRSGLVGSRMRRGSASRAMHLVVVTAVRAQPLLQARWNLRPLGAQTSK